MKYVKIIKPDRRYTKDGPFGGFIVGHVFIARDMDDNLNYHLYPTREFDSFKNNESWSHANYSGLAYLKSCCEDVTKEYIDRRLEETKF